MLALGETGGTKFSTEQNVPRAVTIETGLYAATGSIDLVRRIVLDRVDVSIVIRCYYLPPVLNNYAPVIRQVVHIHEIKI